MNETLLAEVVGFESRRPPLASFSPVGPLALDVGLTGLERAAPPFGDFFFRIFDCFK